MAVEVRIHDGYFKRLLNNERPNAAISGIERFWAHRADPSKPDYRLTEAEATIHRVRTYFGEVMSCGHACILKRIDDEELGEIEAALEAVSLSAAIEVLAEARQLMVHRQTVTGAVKWTNLSKDRLRQLNRLIGEIRRNDDADAALELSEAKALLVFARANVDDILRPERGLGW